jgi:hypothetical protein
VVAAGTCLALIASSATASSASVATHVRPTITATQASFTIPAAPAGVWLLRLWTLPAPPTTLVGQVEGTSGTLTLPVPQTASCEFQADVRYAAPGTTTFTWYSGLIATVPGCGQSGNGERLTPGFWKTHPTATQALLPQNLGSYTVSTAAEATAIFQDMKCSDAIDCLAGHLLGAELDVANGSSICIVGTIFQANMLLEKVGYNGPASYVVSPFRRAKAISLASELDAYTNDSTSSSC